MSTDPKAIMTAVKIDSVPGSVRGAVAGLHPGIRAPGVLAGYGDLGTETVYSAAQHHSQRDIRPLGATRSVSSPALLTPLI